MKLIKRKDGTYFNGYGPGPALAPTARWSKGDVVDGTIHVVMFFGEVDIKFELAQLLKMKYDVRVVDLAEVAPPGPNAVAQARITCARELYAKALASAAVPDPVPFEQLNDNERKWWLALADADSVMRGTD